jgi:Cdc6-like AAA superfamily ATPase
MSFTDFDTLMAEILKQTNESA